MEQLESPQPLCPCRSPNPMLGAMQDSRKQIWQNLALREGLSHTPHAASEQRGYLRVKFMSPVSTGFGLLTPGALNCLFQPPCNNQLRSWPILADLRNVDCVTGNGKLIHYLILDPACAKSFTHSSHRCGIFPYRNPCHGKRCRLGASVSLYFDKNACPLTNS